jgi:predicted dehydrogenase
MTGPRIGLVGAGVMGGYHARVVAQSEHSSLAWVADPSEATGSALAQRHGVDWRPEVNSWHNVDAVIVASPTDTHAAVVLSALENDVPVLVEKPVSGSLDEAELMVGLAEKRDVPVMCGLVERFNPALLTVMPMLDEPAHITAVRHSPYANRIKTGVGWDLLIHDVDACLRLAGDDEPTHVRAGVGVFHPLSSDGYEDVAETVMMFRNGAMASASASRIGQRKVRQVTVTDLHRTIELDLLRRDVTIYRHVSAELGDQGNYRQQTIIEIPELVTAREPLAAQLDHFLDVITGKADAARERQSILPAHRVIARVMESHGDGRQAAV